MQCEDTQDYRFRYEGAQVVCNLKLLFNAASGLIMERSEAECNTNAGKVIRPTGAQPVNITEDILCVLSRFDCENILWSQN